MARERETIKEKAMEFPTSAKVNQSLLEHWLTADRPGGRGSLTMFRDDQGRIGGYAAHSTVMDSPIHYFDALGKPLGTFHIFGDAAENKKTQKIVDALKEKFPHEDDAGWPAPLPRPGGKNPLLGKWAYEGCTIKNTRVEGVLTFLDEPPLMIFDGDIRRDYPTTAFRSDYNYRVKGGGLSFKEPSDPRFHPPVGPHFLVEDGILYFSNDPITEVPVSDEDLDRPSGWLYKLRKTE
jgi:hypothetical protein